MHQSSLGFGTTSCLLPLTKQRSAGTPDLATAGPLYHFRHKMAAESNKMYTTRKQEGGVPESGEGSGRPGVESRTSSAGCPLQTQGPNTLWNLAGQI